MKRTRMMMTLLAMGLMLGVGASYAHAQGGPPGQRGGFDGPRQGNFRDNFRGDFRGDFRGRQGPGRAMGRCPYDCSACQRFDKPRGFDSRRGDGYRGRGAQRGADRRGGWGMDGGYGRGRWSEAPRGDFRGPKSFREPGNFRGQAQSDFRGRGAGDGRRGPGFNNCPPDACPPRFQGRRDFDGPPRFDGRRGFNRQRNFDGPRRGMRMWDDPDRTRNDARPRDRADDRDRAPDRDDAWDRDRPRRGPGLRMRDDDGRPRRRFQNPERDRDPDSDRE